ncbi:autotransporter domain-containing protein [Sphingomonas sp. M1-B02]|uniref:autotransporter domain-containing protein n=1 Tax=Sphingomonas sp. M1-B02 TaxID=3114300 RepID=UPI002240744D|nr:autotransporter domain-containing protein [Sphingomonas sp. S6-11]UZK67844.1 autotransporter domain-containing protein [Sphingomonas sp. S6-11]
MLALAAAALFAPNEASAQATPGSVECPIVDRIVTCSGSLPSGVNVPAGGNRDGLTVQNITGDISVTTRPAIAFVAGTPTSSIRIADADSALRITTTTPNVLARDLNASAILATATNNTSLSLRSDIDLFGRSICSLTSCYGRRALMPVGITVRGSGGTFAIENLGDITLDNDGVGLFTQSAAIVADIFGADLVSIRNAGTLTSRNGGGIIATADNRRIEIINDGTIITTLEEGQSDFGDGAVALQFDPRQFYSDGFDRPDVPQFVDFSYRIVNNGRIQAGGLANNDYNPAIGVNNRYMEYLANGDIAAGFAGRQSGEIINNGSLAALRGVFVDQNGDVSITNNGRIEAQYGIDVTQIIVDGRGEIATTRIVNTALGAIEIDALGESSRFGISVNGGIVDIGNAGLIDVTGPNSSGIKARGSSYSNAFRPAGLFTIANSGQILASGTGAFAIEVSRSHLDETGPAPDQRNLLINSGTVAASGDGAVGLYLDSVGLGGPENIGTFEVGLSASSVVRGGSGDGAGIRFIGGERNVVRNAGVITATSGTAIIGDLARETIDNSGRIEGSVSLRAGDDRFEARTGGVLTGALDGGDGTDAIGFDVAGGTVAFADRIGGAVTGFELLEKTGGGTLTLNAGAATRTALSGGRLRTSGDLGAMRVDAAAGTVLEASGTLGAVTIADGATLSAGGGEVGTLRLASLALGANSIARFDLGQAGTVGGATNDLIEVTGNLVLDGRLDVAPRPGFGNGVYRLFNYGGTLTDNGLVTGTGSTADYQVQTATAGQVNLVVGNFTDILFWDGGDSIADGLVDGGNGTWTAAGINWTNANGAQNRAWSPAFATFQGAAGTVSVEGAQSVRGLQFLTSGYRLTAGTNGSLGLDDAESVIRVGPGATADVALPVTGTGALVKRDPGTLILSGSNSYTGGTQVREGVLQISAEAALGTGGVTLDGGTLRAGASFASNRGLVIAAGGGTLDTQENMLTVSGALGGAGTLTKAGNGILSLSGNNSGYAGAARVAAGTLNLAGTLGGSLLIDSGATLSGTGTTGSLTVNGTIAPGNSAGTLTVNGNLILGVGSNYQAELSAAGQSDRILVTGMAQLNGGTLTLSTLSPELEFTDGSSIRILEATGGVSGTFGRLVESSAFLDFVLGYAANAVDVRVNVVRTFPTVAQTFNQTNAATGLRDFAQAAGSDSLSVYRTLLLLDEAPARAAFDSASGEIYGVLRASQQRQGQAAASRFATRALTQGGAGWSLWGGLLGLNGSVRSDGNGARFTQDQFGGDVGIGYAATDARWTVGVGGGWGKGDVHLPGRASRAAIDGWHLGAYARAGTGGAGFTASAAVVHQANEARVNRGIALGTLSRTAGSRVDSGTISANAEVRYGFGNDGWILGPTAGVLYSRAELSRFAETGAQSLDISADDQSNAWTRYGAGIFARYAAGGSWLDASVRTLLNGRGDSAVALRLAGAAGTTYRVRPAQADRWGVEAKLAGETGLGGGWSLGGHAQLVASGQEREIAGQATIRLRF